jgi:hypothetical protein
MTSTTLRKAIIANPMATEHEAAAFLAADEYWDGFAHYWRKLFPSNVYKVLEALVEHTRFNARTWQAGTPPIPSQERLAELGGVSVRTVSRILARDAAGHHTYTYRRCVYLRVTEASIMAYEDERACQVKEQPEVKPWPPCPWRVGDLAAIKRDLAEQLHLNGCYELGDLIDLFIVSVETRRRYDTQQGRWLRTSNTYHVRPIMPLPPTLEAEIAYGLHLADVRRERTDLTAEAAQTRAASGTPLLRNTPNRPAVLSAKLAEESSSVSQTELSKGTSIASLKESPRVDSCAIEGQRYWEPGAIGKPIRNTTAFSPSNQDHAEDLEQSDREIEPDRVRPFPPPVAPRRPAAVALPEAAERIVAEREAQRKRQVWHDRRVQVDAVIGQDIERAAALIGDGAPGATRGVLVSALASTETPLDHLPAALRLIEHRYRRVYGTGGKPIQTKPIAAWITVARSVIAKGRSWAYDFDAQDTKEAHEARLRHDAKAAVARHDTGYIQTPEYYQRIDGRSSAPRGASLIPLSTPEEPLSPHITQPRRPLKRWEDDYDERTGLNRYRRREHRDDQ